MAISRKNVLYIPALTGIRTIAATMVFFHHFNVFIPAIFGKFINGLVDEFHVGVTIFFVLSGFLICYRYYDKISFKTEWLRQYFVNRFARIYPMYFILTVIYSFPFICKCNFWDNYRILLLNLTFLRGYFDDYKFTMVATGWSLTVEETFYILFPAIIYLSCKIKLLMQCLIFLGIGLLLWLIFGNVNFHGFFSSVGFLFEFTFFGRCFEFFSGIYLALIIKSEPPTVILQKRPIKTLAGIIFIFAGIALLSLNRKINLNHDIFIIYETLINNFLLPPAIALFFYGLIYENSFLKRLLESRVFIVLGKSSYIFYLIHNGILFYLLYVKLEIKIWFVFPILQIISVVLYYAMEKPLNAYIRAWAKKKLAIANN